MIARPPLALVLLVAVILPLRAASVAPLDAALLKATVPAAPPVAVAAEAPAPATGTPPAAATDTPAKNSDGTPVVAPPAAVTPAAGVHKPGILTAVKAKGPPAAGKGAAAPVALSPRFQQVRTKMSALFDTRNAPPAPIDARTNPFRPVGAGPIAPLPVVDGATTVPIALNTDLTSLQQAVATLRVKGTVQRGNKTQLVITTAPGKEGNYKEGDIINVVMPVGDSVHLRVRQVTVHSVTLLLNEAEMTLKF